MLDLVQVLSDRMGQMAAMDEDSVHWIGVAVRESRHQRHQARQPRTPGQNRHRRVRLHSQRGADRARGPRPRPGRRASIPTTSPNPLDPENILKSSGRGIFFMRSFMDDVQLERAPEGGMEVRMVKKLAAGG